VKRVVEVRSYQVKAGTRDSFHHLVCEHSIPMLKRWDVDVVAFGPSPHDDVSYYLIRSYESLEHREASQGAFYGSAEWREGPRDTILPLIESYTTIVLELESEAVNSLRSGIPGRIESGAEGGI
jgi:hypothetical protein